MSSLRIWWDIDSLDEQLAIVYEAVTVLQVCYTLSYRLDLRPFQHHSGHVFIEQLVIESCLSVPYVDITRKSFFSHYRITLLASPFSESFDPFCPLRSGGRQPLR